MHRLLVIITALFVLAGCQGEHKALQKSIKAEFKVNDLITYMPYETGHPSVIKAVNVDRAFCKKNSVYYEISGVGSNCVKIVTSGINIAESKHFKEDEKLVQLWLLK